MPFGGIPAHSALLPGKPESFVLDCSGPEQGLCTAGNQQMGWGDWEKGLAVSSREKGSRESYVSRDQTVGDQMDHRLVQFAPYCGN